jgi:Photoprotection regulator fluorescence recovery protein
MTDLSIEGWSASEQLVAREAFARAYDRAIQALSQEVHHRAATLDSAESIWSLHDYLSIERHKIEGRFDFRFDGLLFVFASLVKDDLLEAQELVGLSDDKLAKISAMARF